MPLRKFYDFLQLLGHKGIIIAAGSAGIATTTVLIHGISPPALLLISMFLMMFSVYRVNKILDLKEDTVNFPERAEFIRKSKGYWLILPFLMGFSVALGITFFTNLWAFFLTLISVLWIYLYSIPLPSFLQRLIGYSRIKEIPVIKTIYTSVAWAAVSLISIFFIGARITYSTIAIFLLVFIRIVVGAIIFDIRDIRGDKEFGIITIPVLLGKKKTGRLLLILNLVSLVFVMLMVQQKIFPSLALFLLPVIIYSQLLSSEAVKAGADLKFLCNVLVDLEYVFLGIMASVGAAILGFLY